ncbi:hypothetical protein BCR44DRAFT_1443618, partial [Catenaria anguillulae PL171]
MLYAFVVVVLVGVSLFGFILPFSAFGLHIRWRVCLFYFPRTPLFSSSVTACTVTEARCGRVCEGQLGLFPL